MQITINNTTAVHGTFTYEGRCFTYHAVYEGRKPLPEYGFDKPVGTGTVFFAEKVIEEEVADVENGPGPLDVFLDSWDPEPLVIEGAVTGAEEVTVKSVQDAFIGALNERPTNS